MPKAKLDARNIGKWPAPPDGQPPIDYFDSGPDAVPWFTLRVHSDGRRVFTVGYRAGIRRRRITIGEVGTGKMSLGLARAYAKQIRARVQLGEDPAEEKSAARTADTFASVLSAYIEHRRAHLAPATLKQYALVLASKLQGSDLGRMAAATVRRDDVRLFLGKVRQNSGPVAANRTFQLLSAAVRWAEAEETIPRLSLLGMRPSPERARERALSDQEVAALWASLEEANTPMMAAAVRLLLLLGQRAAETINGLRWDALALKGDPPTWTLPGSFRKGGRLHVVPLPPLAVRIIEELRPITGDKARVLHRVGEQNAERLWWGPARERALAEFKRRGMPAERFTRHDLRRTAGTGIVRLTGNRFIMQRALGHAESGVGPIYDRHAYLREKYAALCAWADHVEGLVSAARREQASA